MKRQPDAERTCYLCPAAAAAFLSAVAAMEMKTDILLVQEYRNHTYQLGLNVSNNQCFFFNLHTRVCLLDMLSGHYIWHACVSKHVQCSESKYCLLR